MYFLFGIYHAITIESQELTKDMLLELLEGAFSARDYKKRLVLVVVRHLVAHVGGYDEDLVAWMESQKIEPPPYLLNEVKRNKRRSNRKGKNQMSLNYMGRSSSSRVALTRSRANLRKTESNLQQVSTSAHLSPTPPKAYLKFFFWLQKFTFRARWRGS